MTSFAANAHAIILAAGASSRLGRPKQLLNWQGRPLLAHAIENADALLPGRIIVVLGAHADAIQAAVKLHKVQLAHNADWQEGIASSIRAGIKELPASAEAALLLLCDQPLIGREHLQLLLNARQNRPSRIVASHYHDSVGVPALFPAEYFGELLTLQGDRGAKRLLLEHREVLVEIPLKQAELDIDDTADFHRLCGLNMPERKP
ncbi:nucleotidyltransferase family protein [Methylomarinum vadi]|uniref:nucleotidyltransferase family protein n=1 Tax=Methylomarinum vadi TaxID=438855 RepID=UPI0004DEDC0E|nr:nucleotidyltransferase family protein [Methylomarinum vadi]